MIFIKVPEPVSVCFSSPTHHIGVTVTDFKTHTTLEDVAS